MRCVAVRPLPAAPGNMFSQYACAGIPEYAESGAVPGMPCAERINCPTAVK